MRLLLPLLLELVLSVSAVAQKPATVDSLLVVLPIGKAEALDRTVAAFTAAGMPVTNTTPVLIESEWSTQPALSRSRAHWTIRALLLGRGPDTTAVLLRGTVEGVRGMVVKRSQAVTNRTGGTATKVWGQMRAAARMLDSTQVSVGLRPEGADIR